MFQLILTILIVTTIVCNGSTTTGTPPMPTTTGTMPPYPTTGTPPDPTTGTPPDPTSGTPGPTGPTYPTETTPNYYVCDYPGRFKGSLMATWNVWDYQACYYKCGEYTESGCKYVTFDRITLKCELYETFEGFRDCLTDDFCISTTYGLCDAPYWNKRPTWREI